MPDTCRYLGNALTSVLAIQQKSGQGALAQYISISPNLIAPRPPSLVATQAAGIALTGVTAHQGLFRLLQIESGQHIFINGGSSSVGSFAIQLAKAHGCSVTATCSAANIDLVKSLGADEVRYQAGLAISFEFTNQVAVVHRLSTMPPTHPIPISSPTPLLLNFMAYLIASVTLLSCSCRAQHTLRPTGCSPAWDLTCRN